MTYIELIKDKRATNAEQKQLQGSMVELVKLLSEANSQAPKDFTDKVDQLSKNILSALSAFKDDKTVSNQIDTLSSEFKQIAILLSKYNKDNTASLTDALDKMADSIQTIKDTPVIIKGSDINIAPLEKAITQAISSIDNSQPLILDNFRPHDQRDDGDMQYFGFVNPEGKWYILENDVKGNSFRYVFGNKNYKSSFRKAASWEYKLLSEAINAIQN